MEAIDRLAVKVFSCLTRKQRKKIFGKDQKQSDFCDKVNSEFREFQTEVIPEEYYIQEQSSQGKPTIHRPSYWADCYNECDISQCSSDAIKVDFEVYWRKVRCIKDEDDNSKYGNLSNVALVLLLLPHGNSDPERGFSINKILLDRHGPNLAEETIEALRTVKDFIIQSGGFLKVEITKSMMNKCKGSRTRYKEFLEEQKKTEAEQQKQKEIEVSKLTSTKMFYGITRRKFS